MLIAELAALEAALFWAIWRFDFNQSYPKNRGAGFKQGSHVSGVFDACRSLSTDRRLAGIPGYNNSNAEDFRVN